MYVAHADDPVAARREISECNERLLSGLGVAHAPPSRPSTNPRDRPERQHHDERTLMAWDFSTEPEFQEKLDWARQFVPSGSSRSTCSIPTVSSTPWTTSCARSSTR